MAALFLDVAPLAGGRDIAITERRTRDDRARYIKEMLDRRYPDAAKVVLAMDNLNTHDIASFYQLFPPAEAVVLPLASKFT